MSWFYRALCIQLPAAYVHYDPFSAIGVNGKVQPNILRCRGKHIYLLPIGGFHVGHIADIIRPFCGQGVVYGSSGTPGHTGWSP